VKTRLWVKLGVGVVVAIAVVVLPLYASAYTNRQLTLVVIYAVAILGLNLVTGYAGQVSLAQAAFFGVGAYATAISGRAGMPAIAALGVAILVPTLIGLIIGLPAARLKGMALAMVTIAASLIAVPLALKLDVLTGGSQGMRVDFGGAPSWSGLLDDQWFYYVAIVVGAVMFLLARNMVSGKIGRGLALIRTNEVVATAMGVPVTRYKVWVFTLSASYAGVAGFLFAYCIRFVSPETLNFLLSIMMLASLVIGGLRSLLGPVLGAAFYVYIPQLAGTVSAEQSAFIYGVVLVLVLLFLPGGIVSLPRVIVLLRRRRARRRSAEADPRLDSTHSERKLLQ
jgi:branched-chain amino acid transport system permease protein